MSSGPSNGGGGGLSLAIGQSLGTRVRGQERLSLVPAKLFGASVKNVTFAAGDHQTSRVATSDQRQVVLRPVLGSLTKPEAPSPTAYDTCSWLLARVGCTNASRSVLREAVELQDVLTAALVCALPPLQLSSINSRFQKIIRSVLSRSSEPNQDTSPRPSGGVASRLAE